MAVQPAPASSVTPRISVVVCSLNGERTIGRCLAALSDQTHHSYEVIVVDDGSTDGTGAIAAASGVRVERHAAPRGIAAARNAGIRIARGTIVAFTDDDCQPAADWLDRLDDVYSRDGHDLNSVAGVGGLIEPAAPAGPLLRYLKLNNPLRPFEREPDGSRSVVHRFARYVVRNVSLPALTGTREVQSLVGANMSFPRMALAAIDGFDERFTFGADDEDICRRLRKRFPDCPLLVNAEATVHHWFDPSLRDTLRRSAAYGRGNARMSLVYGQGVILFPFPIVVAGLVAAGIRRPRIATAGVLAPLVLLPRGPFTAVRSGDWVHLVAPYVQILQESSHNLGFARGWLAIQRRRVT